MYIKKNKRTITTFMINFLNLYTHEDLSCALQPKSMLSTIPQQGKKNIQCCDVVDDNPNTINRYRVIDSTKVLYYCIVTKHQSICFSCGSSNAFSLFFFPLKSSLHHLRRNNFITIAASVLVDWNTSPTLTHG